MPPKRKAKDDSSSAAASDAAAASPPIVAKIKIEGGRTGTTADTAISILVSPPVIEQGSSSSSSSSSSSVAEEQLLKKGRLQGRREMSKTMSDLVICPITKYLMAFPVSADDERTYERAAILKWLETNTTSPLDPSTTISAATLRKNRVVSDMIEMLVKSDDIDDETKQAWQEKRDEPQRLFEAKRVLEAAKLGHVEAMGKMAYNYYHGEGGVAVDNAKAFDFATKAAKEGDGQGMQILGRCYDNGRGVAEDQVAGVKWYEEAAKKGNANGMHCSGVVYSAGKGCVNDDKKAAEYFKNASEKGHRYSTNELGNCYYEGAGVPKNLNTARTFFKKAAAGKHSPGDVNLGTMMICGEGGAKEIGKGFTLIEKAAGDGNKFAVAHLAEIEKVVKKWKKTGVYKLGTR